MPQVDVVATLSAASRLVGQAGAEARADRSRAATRERVLSTKRRKLMDEAAEARVWRRIASFVPVPFLRGSLLSSYDDKARALDKKADDVELSIEVERRRADDATALHRRAARASKNVERAKRYASALGSPPPDSAIAAATAYGQISFLARARRGRGWAEDAVGAAESAVEVVAAWANNAKRAEEARKADNIRREAAKSAPSAQRIYLPVPVRTAREAERMGAHYDQAARSGESRVFVTQDLDLTPFQNMLPLAFRSNPMRFEFPPVPMRAAGQNLWGMFDKETWNHVRGASTDMAGRRCLICGKRGGWFAERVFGKDERRDGVECHEVWEWEVPDESNGVGIQRLKRILVVCPDCHMMFHEGYATKRGREAGLEREAAEYVQRRRLMVNRVDEATLTRSIEASKDALSRMTGIDRWIVDLSALSQQQFMADRTPIMREANDAQLSPDRIAGLSFATDRGRSFEARSADDIYRSLVDVDYGDDVVVAFPRR